MAGNDFVNVEGIADLSDATVQFAVDPGVGGFITLLTASSIDLTGTQILGLPDGFTFQIVNIPGGQAFQIAPPIPEPSSLLLCGLGMIGLARGRRRRKSMVV